MTAEADSDAIATERLLLRRFRPADAPAMHAILSDPAAMRFWSTPPHAALAQTLDWLARSIAAAEAGEADEFAVLFEGKVVGKTGLWRGNEIGLIFAPAVWGRGIAREATAAVLARADRRGLERVVADADPRNARVLRLLSGLGFVETGRAAHTVCVAGAWSDSVFLGRIRPSRAF